MSHRIAIVGALVIGLVGCGGGAGRARTSSSDGPRAERRDDVRDARVDAQSGWDKLGERWVDGKTDRDVLPVGRDDGRFSAIKLVVERSALELSDIVVTFGDGTTFSPQTRLVFRKNETSRTIDLPGGKRVIKKVEFKYANLPGGGRAQVEVWAR